MAVATTVVGPIAITRADLPVIEVAATGTLAPPERNPDEPEDGENDGGDPQHVDGEAGTSENQDQ